ncbi:ABC transporter substrate-binding protein [bacterium]|nr:ABC transporter substrate-binding protein [bacterium]
MPIALTFQQAKGVTYERQAHGARLVVRASFDDGSNQFENRFFDGPAPRDGRTIGLPVQRMVCLSSTHLGFLEELDAIDRVVGVSARRHVSHRALLDRIANGDVVEVGSGMPIDTERLLACRPDVVVTFGVNESDVEPFAMIQRAGIPVLVVAEYTEDDPLGRAEWIKVFGLLVGKVDLAQTRYEEIARQYESLRARVSAVKDRPTVLLNASFQGIWYLPGGTSYMARLLSDAGSDYLWKDDQGSRVLTLDFETVFARGKSARYWLNVGFWKTLADGLANDPRYQHFDAFAAGRVFNHMAGAGEESGTDYFERGAARPDLVLADLIRIFHPPSLPMHEMVWYKQLPER